MPLGTKASRADAHLTSADRYARNGNFQKATAHVERALGLLRFGGDGMNPPRACIICLESDPPPIQSGCACRSDTGLAHVGCLIEKAVSQQNHRGNSVWWECQTCRQLFTGAMRTGLAEAWWSRVRYEETDNSERVAAASTLAQAREGEGRYAEAERIIREVLGVSRRVLGEEHPDTLTHASNLAKSLWNQGKFAGAERIHREVLGARKQVLGEEHAATLTSGSNLALSLLKQGKHAEAEPIQRLVLGARKRVLGEDHPDTLRSASHLAVLLGHRKKYEEAEHIIREALGAQRRVLGEEHPDTLSSANNLATSLCAQGKYAEAEQIQGKVLWARKQVLGEEHPVTRATAESLEALRSNMRRTQRPHRKLAATPLSPVALAEAEARAAEAEAELLAMLNLGGDQSQSKPKGPKGPKGPKAKPNGKAGKR
jgi:tetratricopeptide (TPR) repeat protein